MQFIKLCQYNSERLIPISRILEIKCFKSPAKSTNRMELNHKIEFCVDTTGLLDVTYESIAFSCCELDWSAFTSWLSHGNTEVHSMDVNII